MSFITDLINKITNFRVKVGDKLNTLKNQIGQLNSLTTNDKTSLVGAVNEVNNIQIGGRNLLLQTTTSEINLVGGVDIYAEKAYKISNLEKNTEYIFSVIAKGDEMTLISFIPNVIVDYKSLTTEFKLYTWKFSTSNEPAVLDLLIRAQAGKNITITKAKLEKGNKATDWTPAPEDQVSDWNETDSNALSFIKNKPTIPTVNNGQLTLSTGTGLSGSANFTANQAGGSTFSVDVASTHKLPSTAEWIAALANTTYTAGNGLTLSGTTFSLPVTTSGSGNVVSEVTQTTNGITVNKGISAMTTSHVANSIDQNLSKSSNPTFNSIELSAPVPYIDFHFANSTADYTSRITENSLGGLNLISKTSLKYNVDGVAEPFLKIDRYNAVLGSSSNDFEAVTLKTLFGSVIFDDGGLKSSSHVIAPAYYESSLRRFKTNIKSFTKSGLDIINSLKIVTFDRNDSNIKNKVGIIADDSPSEVLSETRNEVDLYKTIFVQAKAIQELDSKNKTLEERINQLEEIIKNML